MNSDKKGRNVARNTAGAAALLHQAAWREVKKKRVSLGAEYVPSTSVRFKNPAARPGEMMRRPGVLHPPCSKDSTLEAALISASASSVASAMG